MFGTTTHISDSINLLDELIDRLDHIPYMPEEQVIGLIASGAIMIDNIMSGLDVSLFTQEEVEFIVRVNSRLTEELQELTGVDENYE